MKLTRRVVTAFAIASSAVAVISARAVAQKTAPPADTGYVTYDDGPISLPLGVGCEFRPTIG
jgi:hypothetical protein